VAGRAAVRVAARDLHSITIQGGMRNASLAPGTVVVRFGGELGLVIPAGLRGTWHIVSGLTLAGWLRRRDARSAPG
jgi:bile acid:Na+ symporter, BASS family